MSYKLKLMRVLEKKFTKLKGNVQKVKPVPSKAEAVMKPVLLSEASKVDILLPPAGLRSYNVAPTTRNVYCRICNGLMHKGEARFSYRFKSSSTPRDEKFIHVGCSNGPLCSATKAVDKHTLIGWLTEAPVDSPMILAALRDALAGLELA